MCQKTNFLFLLCDTASANMQTHVHTSGLRTKQWVVCDGREKHGKEGQPAELPVEVSAAPGWLEPSADTNAHPQNQKKKQKRKKQAHTVTVKHPSDSSVKKGHDHHELHYVPFSKASPMMIFPPLLLVFSTDSAVLRPCSCFPRPWPSLKPYFCMILWATVPLRNKKKCSGFINGHKLYVATFHV